MEYEWDEQKNLLNIKKHGLSFELAPNVFSNVHLTRLDVRQDYRETRYLTMGMLIDRVVIVVHTMRGCAIRIISMRKANEREKKIYHEKVKYIYRAEFDD